MFLPYTKIAAKQHCGKLVSDMRCVTEFFQVEKLHSLTLMYACWMIMETERCILAESGDVVMCFSEKRITTAIAADFSHNSMQVFVNWWWKFIAKCCDCMVVLGT